MFGAKRTQPPVEMPQSVPLYAVVHEQTTVWQVTGWRGDRPLLVPVTRYQLGVAYRDEETAAVAHPTTGRYCPDPQALITYALQPDAEILMSTIKPWLRTKDGLNYYGAWRRRTERESQLSVERRERELADRAGSQGLTFYPTRAEDVPTGV